MRVYWLFIYGLAAFLAGLWLMILPYGLVHVVVWAIIFFSLGSLFFRRDLTSLLLLGFILFLSSHPLLPAWLLRVGFACYCILNSMALGIQWGLNVVNGVKKRHFGLLLTLLWLICGLFLLFKPHFHVRLLLQTFGFYLVLLGIRHFQDGLLAVNPLVKNQWKRRIRLPLPLLMNAILPDWLLIAFNRHLEDSDFLQEKEPVKDQLEVMIHVGPKGLGKIGHIGFAYQNLVYNYGNYDMASSKWKRLFGRALVLVADRDLYLDVLCQHEQNTIFSYQIDLSQSDQEHLKQALDQLNERLEPWQLTESGLPFLRLLEKKARFYRIRSGSLKYYFALGDNCAYFTDMILGSVGADILSMRGILTPGTYVDYLQTEWLKANSPIRSIQVYRPKEKRMG